MPPKRSTAAPAASLTTATDEGTRLLELSKKWRTELRASEKSDKPYIGICLGRSRRASHVSSGIFGQDYGSSGILS